MLAVCSVLGCKTRRDLWLWFQSQPGEARKEEGRGEDKTGHVRAGLRAARMTISMTVSILSASDFSQLEET